MDLARYGLCRDDEGIWRPRWSVPQEISFPETGHDACFQIEDNSFWFAHRNACIIASLARYTFEGPLLDVGGGNGAVSHALERAGIDTILLEPGAAGARNARRRGVRDVVCATLDGAAFEPLSFGAAGLFDVIEHVSDDESLLRAVYRVLRFSGIACLTVPAYRWLWSAEDDLAGHHRRYTLTHLSELCTRSGFDVLYRTYLFAPLVAPMFAIRSIPYRIWNRSLSAVEERATEQHTPSKAARIAIETVLRAELRRVRHGRYVPFGTTCLVVAAKS